MLSLSLFLEAAAWITPPGVEESEDTYGPELMVDGVNFASGYTNTSGTSNAGGMVNLTGTALPRASLALTEALIPGREYELVYTVLNYTAGLIALYAGGIQALTSRSANNTYTERFTADSAYTSMQVRGPGSGRGSADNISLREVNPPEVAPLLVLTWEGIFVGVSEASPQGITIGNLEGRAPGSTLTLIDDAGGRAQIDGAQILTGATALDYETATSHEITVRETLAGAPNSPLDTVLTFSVTDEED